jgi:hypothetical protein
MLICTTVSPGCWKLTYCGPSGVWMAVGVPGGMGQAIWPGASAALTPLPVPLLLTLVLPISTLEGGTTRGSGGSW